VPIDPLAEITDMNMLKALAYDQIAAKEQSERNLQAINTRIAELSRGGAPPPADPEETTNPVHNGRVTKPRAKS
jgi:hypothetical protein